MNPLLILIILVPLIAFILVAANYALAPHRPIFSKKGTYECGLLARSNQSRQPFSVLFYIVCTLFLVFDLEIVLVFPLVSVLSYVGMYGFWILVIFFTALTVGFVIELASGALAFNKV